MIHTIQFENNDNFSHSIDDGLLTTDNPIIININEQSLMSIPNLVKAYYTNHVNTYMFYFIDGMTWGEYVNSEFNTIGFYINSYDEILHPIEGYVYCTIDINGKHGGSYREASELLCKDVTYRNTTGSGSDD